MNKLIFTITLTCVMLFFLYSIYCISIILLLCYLGYGVHYTVRYALKNNIPYHNTFGGQVADIIFITILVINWLPFKMFNYNL